ncbi:glycosyltransferase family 2 protein [Desulfococcaceae bacterium HSG9]|nr:glycosyltransferase family 2 protein [Desulfococcaceae bacterium HSG9]
MVTIIIPNLNGKKFLKTCLDSIFKQQFQNFTVTVVDNGSDDGSVKFIKAEYPTVLLIQFACNKGFSAAINSGIRKADSKYICLLNNDIELDPYFLKELVAVLEVEKDVQYCAPKMLDYYQRDKMDGAGDGVFRAGAGYKRGSLDNDNGRYDRQLTVFGACAGAALYRRSFFNEVGLFDEDFFAYLEDVDINMRASLLGLTCLYAPAAKVYHIGSATTGSVFNPFTVRLSTKNLFNVVIKNYPSILILKFLPSLILYHFFWFGLVVSNKQSASYFRGVLTAVSDFPKMWRKRKKTLMLKSVSCQSLLLKISQSEKEVMEMILRRSRKRKGRAVTPVELYLKLFF